MNIEDLTSELNIRKNYQKKDNSKISIGQVYGRRNKYEHLFDLDNKIIKLKK